MLQHSLWIVPLGIFLTVLFVVAMIFRTVVDTNKVHIVQSRKRTISYGTGQASGNVYYRWPSAIPIIGVKSIILPVNNFDLDLDAYKAYDKDRVPFELDLMAFFRISDTNIAAQRVETFDNLEHQLRGIVQGAARKILASHDIDVIMVDRATFGAQFTEEVKAELANWGVEPVKNMELMDIRDTDGSKIIANIMAKKSSHIAMESRIEVAQNMRAAEMAEIEAQQAVNVRTQEAEQAVGERTAQKEKQVGIAKQLAQQEVTTQAAVTRDKEMDVIKVGAVRKAEIDKQAAIVTAEQEKEVAVINADGALQATIKHAEGVAIDGKARGEAETAVLMAPVNSQIALAREIGTNQGYQTYLVSLKGVEGYVAVGTAQAEALKSADVKVIASTGDAVTGVNTAMQLFTPKGGTAVGGMLEALAQTPHGQQLLAAVTGFMGGGKSDPDAPLPNGAAKN